MRSSIVWYSFPDTLPHPHPRNATKLITASGRYPWSYAFDRLSSDSSVTMKKWEKRMEHLETLNWHALLSLWQFWAVRVCQEWEMRKIGRRPSKGLVYKNVKRSWCDPFLCANWVINSMMEKGQVTLPFPSQLLLFPSNDRQWHLLNGKLADRRISRGLQRSMPSLAPRFSHESGPQSQWFHLAHLADSHFEF
jgi:hypothetical protein